MSHDQGRACRDYLVEEIRHNCPAAHYGSRRAAPDDSDPREDMRERKQHFIGGVQGNGEPPMPEIEEEEEETPPKPKGQEPHQCAWPCRPIVRMGYRRSRELTVAGYFLAARGIVVFPCLDCQT